jgi:DNA-binding transcriptional regulator YiaG
MAAMTSDEFADIREKAARRLADGSVWRPTQDDMVKVCRLLSEYDRLAARASQAEAALLAANAREAGLQEMRDSCRKIMDKAALGLAFAFNRIHTLPRTQDTELATSIGKVKAEIEAWEKQDALSTPSPTADKLMAVVEAARAWYENRRENNAAPHRQPHDNGTTLRLFAAVAASLAGGPRDEVD